MDYYMGGNARYTRAGFSDIEGRPILCKKEKAESENWQEFQNSFCVNDPFLLGNSYGFTAKFRENHCPDDVNNPMYRDLKLKDTCQKTYEASSDSYYAVDEVKSVCTKEKAEGSSWDQIKNSFCLRSQKVFNENSDFREAVRKTHCPNDIDDAVYQDPHRKKICEKMQELSPDSSSWDMDCTADRGGAELYGEARKSSCVKNPMVFIFNPNWRAKFTEKNCPNNINDPIYTIDPERKEICGKAYDYNNRGVGNNWLSSLANWKPENWCWTCNQGLGNEPIKEIIATDCLNPNVAKANPNFLSDFKGHHCVKSETLKHPEQVVREIVNGACATPIEDNMASSLVSLGQDAIVLAGEKAFVVATGSTGVLVLSVASANGVTDAIVDGSEDLFNEALFGSEDGTDSPEYKKRIEEHEARKAAPTNTQDTFVAQQQENNESLYAQDVLDKQINLIKADEKDELGDGACTSSLGEESIENIIMTTTCLKPTKRKNNPLFLKSFKENHCGNGKSLNHVNTLVKELVIDSCASTIEHTYASRAQQAADAVKEYAKGEVIGQIPYSDEAQVLLGL